MLTVSRSQPFPLPSPPTRPTHRWRDSPERSLTARRKRRGSPGAFDPMTGSVSKPLIDNRLLLLIQRVDSSTPAAVRSHISLGTTVSLPPSLAGALSPSVDGCCPSPPPYSPSVPVSHGGPHNASSRNNSDRSVGEREGERDRFKNNALTHHSPYSQQPLKQRISRQSGTAA